jgi:O-antigen/teichoic acid export membrane protein
LISSGAWFGGLNGAIMGLSISAFVRCAIHNWWLRRESRSHHITPRYRGSLRREKAILLTFALPSAIAGYYSMPLVWLANSFLVRQPGGYGEMALYSAANNLRILVLFLPNVMNNVGLSVLNNEKSKGDVTNYKNVFRANVKYIFTISMIAVLIAGICGRPILQLFGKEFEAGNSILWLLLITSLFESLSTALYQYVQSKAQIWLSFFCISIPRDTFFILAAFFLVKPFGGEGLAAAFMSSTFIGLICHIVIVFLLINRQKS